MQLLLEFLFVGCDACLKLRTILVNLALKPLKFLCASQTLLPLPPSRHEAVIVGPQILFSALLAASAAFVSFSSRSISLRG